jgi:hypothetical protein
LELTSSWSKQGKGGGRAPFSILADATDTYRADDIELWWEFERASWNRRQLTWSTGRMDLRKFAGLGREAADDEIAAEEADGEDGARWSGTRGSGSAVPGSKQSCSRRPMSTASRARWPGSMLAGSAGHRPGRRHDGQGPDLGQRRRCASQGRPRSTARYLTTCVIRCVYSTQ